MLHLCSSRGIHMLECTMCSALTQHGIRDAVYVSPFKQELQHCSGNRQVYRYRYTYHDSFKAVRCKFEGLINITVKGGGIIIDGL